MVHNMYSRLKINFGKKFNKIKTEFRKLRVSSKTTKITEAIVPVAAKNKNNAKSLQEMEFPTNISRIMRNSEIQSSNKPKLKASTSLDLTTISAIRHSTPNYQNLRKKVALRKNLSSITNEQLVNQMSSVLTRKRTKNSKDKLRKNLSELLKNGSVKIVSKTDGQDICHFHCPNNERNNCHHSNDFDHSKEHKDEVTIRRHHHSNTYKLNKQRLKSLDSVRKTTEVSSEGSDNFENSCCAFGEAQDDDYFQELENALVDQAQRTEIIQERGVMPIFHTRLQNLKIAIFLRYFSQKSKSLRTEKNF